MSFFTYSSVKLLKCKSCIQNLTEVEVLSATCTKPSKVKALAMQKTFTFECHISLYYFIKIALLTQMHINEKHILTVLLYMVFHIAITHHVLYVNANVK